MSFILTIISQMALGNFSFLILVIGVIQMFLMIKNSKKNEVKEFNYKEEVNDT